MESPKGNIRTKSSFQRGELALTAEIEGEESHIDYFYILKSEMTAMYIPQFANSAELRHWQGVGWDETRKSRRRFLKVCIV